MPITTNQSDLDRFRDMLRTVDPASLTTEDGLALIDLLQQALLLRATERASA